MRLTLTKSLMCAIIKRIMKKFWRGAILSVFAMLLGVFSLSAPVFADPAPTNPTPETPAVTAPEDNTTTTVESNGTEDPKSCSKQAGGQAWFICQGTGTLANLIDGAYGLLEYLIKVDPLPTEENAPFRIVWNYFRTITNSLFIVVLLICILSQITGFGINNYGIKRALPRLVIIAIAANLSYLLCQVAVDLSNILGHGLKDFFASIETQAIADGTINTESAVNASALVSKILGIGVATVVAGTAVLSQTGGFTGIMWLILPILLTGALAVISAIATMAARQALIYLLTMVSPLAIIAYALPNTESWAKKWYALLLRMLIFFPMFAVMYGASHLAGFVVMTSANVNDERYELQLVLGFAIQILPLFSSISLMRMSGTILGKISDIINKTTKPATASFGRFAEARRRNTLARQRSGLGRGAGMSHNRLAQYLERRRNELSVDTALHERTAKESGEASYYRNARNRNGRYNRRAAMYYIMQENKLNNANERMEFDTKMDSGLAENEVTAGYRNIARQVNTHLQEDVTRKAIAQAHRNDVAHKNASGAATRIRESLEDQGDAAGNLSNESLRIRNMVAESFGIHPGDAAGFEHARSILISDAIADRRKVDSDSVKRHADRFAETRAGRGIIDEVEKTLGRQGEGSSARNLTADELEQYKANVANIDYTIFDAALPEISRRGDHGDIMEILRNYSGNIKDSGDLGNPQDLKLMTAQKHLVDSVMGLKSENEPVALWSKANNIRRSMHDQGIEIEGYISFEDFIQDKKLAGDRDETQYAKVSRRGLVKDEKNKGLVKTQDRTVFKQLLKYKQSGVLENSDFFFDTKDIRGSISSGEMDGELLNNALRLVTNGFDMGKIEDGADAASIQALAARQNDYFKTAENKQAAYEYVSEIVGGMSAKQLSTSKSTAILTLSRMLAAVDGRVHDITYRDDKGVLRHEAMSTTLIELLTKNHAIEELQSRSNSSMRSGMNPTVAKLVGVLSPDN